MTLKMLEVTADGRHFAVEVVDGTNSFDGKRQ